MAPPTVFVIGPNANVAERWARDRQIPAGQWRVLTNDEYRLRGHAAGNTVVVLNGAFRNPHAGRVIEFARHRGMRVAYENELCQHREPCNLTSPATCFHPDYVAQISASAEQAGLTWDDVLWQRAPGLAARVREHRAAAEVTA